MKQITFGSLFAGIGGFDLGFERAGMTCKWQVEIDDYATRVLAKHWPHVHRERDIREVGSHNVEQVDVICGGFPCQDISYAGKGAGLHGERSGLFFEAMRVVREMGPRVVVLENVAALLTRGMGEVLGTLDSLGYDAEWHCIPAAAVGAPHIRDRVFVLAYTQSERCGRKRKHRERQKERTTGSGEVLANTNSARRKGDDRRIVESRNITRCGWWEVEPSVGRVVDGVSNRSHRLRGLGNAVVPQVAEWIGKQVVEFLEKEFAQ